MTNENDYPLSDITINWAIPHRMEMGKDQQLSTSVSLETKEEYKAEFTVQVSPLYHIYHAKKPFEIPWTVIGAVIAAAGAFLYILKCKKGKKAAKIMYYHRYVLLVCQQSTGRAVNKDKDSSGCSFGRW